MSGHSLGQNIAVSDVLTKRLSENVGMVCMDK